MPMKGALLIFRLAGIRVYLHFTWFIVAALELRSIWLGILAFFIFAQAQAGWRAAQNLAIESEDTARHEAAISPPPIPEQQR
jgi:hypothetical protein